MNHHALRSLLGGTVGGVLATTFVRKSMPLGQRLPERLRPPPIRRDPAEYLIEKFEQRRGSALSAATHRRVAKSLPWAYGLGWTAVLATLGPSLKIHRLGRALLAGAALGAGIWAVSYAGWLPRVGLAPRLREQGTHTVSPLLAHLGFGVLAALPLYAAHRIARGSQSERRYRSSKE